MKTRHFMRIFLLLLILACASAQALPSTQLKQEEDKILHTTVFHNRDHKTLDFLVTFGIGYGDANHCEIVKQRIFKSTHADGYEAHNYGRYLAQEYGPELFTCVHENLHVIGSQYPDESMTYAITNNGEYYTNAIPDRTDVYPR